MEIRCGLCIITRCIVLEKDWLEGKLGLDVGAKSSFHASMTRSGLSMHLHGCYSKFEDSERGKGDGKEPGHLLLAESRLCLQGREQEFHRKAPFSISTAIVREKIS
jgi:hypothetical protein